jgi:quercetin dioxygenase-like cupin family protein
VRSFTFLGVAMKVLLSSAETGGQFSMIEGVMPPGGDGGPHIHHREDESMQLLEGQLEVTIGSDHFTLRQGESYFAPRGIPQRLQNRGDQPARGLLVTTPGGFDEFIAATAASGLGDTPRPGEPAQMIRLLDLAAEFGIQILTP